MALSAEKERKPLIFPPLRFAINLVEKRPAADAQTADDVICNHGPRVSGRELLLLSTRGGAAAAGPQHSAARLTAGDPLVIPINGGTGLYSPADLLELVPPQPLPGCS